MVNRYFYLFHCMKRVHKYVLVKTRFLLQYLNNKIVADESLLRNGSSNSFGDSFLNGTAFGAGSGGFGDTTSKSSSSSNSSSGKSSSSKSSSKSSKHCTIHGFRHSVASILDDNGVPLHDISVLLGHENISTTENIYINRSRTAKKSTTDVLTKVFNLN